MAYSETRIVIGGLAHVPILIFIANFIKGKFGIKIEEAIKMLNQAYKGKEDDPYITDSVGWGYYLTGNYIEAEKYLRKR